MSHLPRGRPPAAPALTSPISEEPSQPVSPLPAAAITWTSVARLTIPGDPAQSAGARLWLRTFLQNHDAARPAADDAVLVVSELVSNALLHSRSGLPGGEITVIAAVRPGRLRLEVTDQGDPRPAGPGAVALDPDERGRGLEIVAALATEWGINAGPGLRTTWAELNVAFHLPTAVPDGAAASGCLAGPVTGVPENGGSDAVGTSLPRPVGGWFRAWSTAFWNRSTFL